VEWPELLQQCSQALREYAAWVESGCAGNPPAMVDPSGVRGPVPDELRPYATQIALQTSEMQQAVAAALTTLRTKAGRAAPARSGYDSRPMPRYLDAMG
jgi:hypothetical protein